MLSSLCCSVVIMLYCYCVALLLFVLSYVLIVCTVPLLPGVNPIAVDRYIKTMLLLQDLLGFSFSFNPSVSGPTVPLLFSLYHFFPLIPITSTYLLFANNCYPSPTFCIPIQTTITRPHCFVLSPKLDSSFSLSRHTRQESACFSTPKT